MKKFAAGVFVVIFFAAWPVFGAMAMVALDVSEGQAVLFEKNGHGLLVDAGPVYKAEELVRDLKQYGVEKLDYLILTHLHPDHASGMFRVVEEWPDAKIIENGHRPPKSGMPDLVRWAWRVIDGHGRVEVAGAGDEIQWQGARIRFLWPGKIRGDRLNRNSLVLYLVHEEERVLIMGDVSSGVEQKLLAKGALEKGADVLVAGHHGSENTSCEKFLKKISPKHSIICIDKNNIRGYPDQDTVERLEKLSEKVHMTMNGDVVFEGFGE